VQQCFSNARSAAKNKNKEGSYQYRRRLTVTNKGAREAKKCGIEFQPTGGKRASEFLYASRFCFSNSAKGLETDSESELTQDEEESDSAAESDKESVIEVEVDAGTGWQPE
jgi:hypothetical protein